MLAMVTSRKLKSSSIIEAIVAVLILLLSFSIGMVMYNKVMLSTYSGIRLRAGLVEGYVADSLVRSGELEDQVIRRGDMSFEVAYKDHELYPHLLIMRLQCYDLSGNKLSEVLKIIRKPDEK